MAWRVSSLNAVWDTPWVKQPTPCALRTLQSLTHCGSVLGAVRWYLLNSAWLIHSVPANTEPTDMPTSLPPVIMLDTPMGASLDFQSLPSALVTAGSQVGGVHAVLLDGAVRGARRDVEDVRADRGGQRRAQRGVVPGDGEHLVGHVDVRVLLVEQLDVLVGGGHRGRPAPPGDVGRGRRSAGAAAAAAAAAGGQQQGGQAGQAGGRGQPAAPPGRAPGDPAAARGRSGSVSGAGG